MILMKVVDVMAGSWSSDDMETPLRFNSLISSNKIYIFSEVFHHVCNILITHVTFSSLYRIHIQKFVILFPDNVNSYFIMSLHFWN